MCKLHPQFIKDADGNNAMVILPMSEYEQLLEELEDIADLQAYKDAKASGAEESMSMSEYIQQRSARQSNG